jgi:hypothetical protein
LKKLWRVIEWRAGDEIKLENLLGLLQVLIFQRVRGDTFKSPLLHFLAVLGIDGETRRLRKANDFSYILAGVVYCARVLSAVILLPSAKREEQGDEDDKNSERSRTNISQIVRTA